jgi:hypothetical protein
LTRILKRAKETFKRNYFKCSDPQPFAKQNYTQTFDTDTLDLFSQLDDFDIISALKSWQRQDDFILSSLSKHDYQ